MNIQIFGRKNCQDTRKAERYFKERRISFQFIDLKLKGLSRGELAKVQSAVGGMTQLIDTQSKEYVKRNLKYMLHDIEETLLATPALFKSPIVRNGAKATIGYQPEVWQTWE